MTRNRPTIVAPRAAVPVLAQLRMTRAGLRAFRRALARRVRLTVTSVEGGRDGA